MTERNGGTVVEKTKRYVLLPWTRQSAVSPIEVATARGCYLYDPEGRQYLDLAAQLVNVNVGHQHPKVIEAIKRQAEELCYAAPSFATRARALDVADALLDQR